MVGEEALKKPILAVKRSIVQAFPGLVDDDLDDVRAYEWWHGSGSRAHRGRSSSAQRGLLEENNRALLKEERLDEEAIEEVERGEEVEGNREGF